MFVIKARFCNNGKLLLGKYQNGICPADPTGPDTVLLQATFSLIHAFRGTIVIPRASLRRNPARRTRRFFALSTFRGRLSNTLSEDCKFVVAPVVGVQTFQLSPRLFLTLAMIHPTCLHLCTKLLSKARKDDAIHPEKSALFTIY